MFSSLRVLSRRTPSIVRASIPTTTRVVSRIPSCVTSTSTSTSTSSTARSFTSISEYDDTDSNYYAGTPIINQLAPHFKAQAVVNGEFKEISLNDYKGKYVVLFFYPLDFTFVCPTEIIAFSDRIQEFRAINTEIIGVSIDSHFSHLAWTKQARKDGGLGKIEYPLVADLTKKISRDYGVLIEEEGFSLRGLFIIDPAGKLRQITVNDTPIGRSVDETIRLLQAFQYHEKHGEVCPANWKPGQATIKTDAEGAKEYFRKANK